MSKKKKEKMQTPTIVGGLSQEIQARKPKSFAGLSEGHEFFVKSKSNKSGEVVCYYYMAAARAGFGVSVEKQGVEGDEYFYKITLRKI